MSNRTLGLRPEQRAEARRLVKEIRELPEATAIQIMEIVIWQRDEWREALLLEHAEKLRMQHTK